MRVLSTLMFALSLSTATSALAQSPAAPVAAPVAVGAPQGDEAGRAKFRAACGADIQKLCGSVVTAEAQSATPETKKEQRGKVRACLTEKKAEVSPGCTAFMAEREAAHAAKKN